MFKRLCIIGVGLIGGSLARAVKRAGLAEQVTGAGRDEAQLKRAQQLGVIDSYDLDIAAAVRGADMIVLAVPLGAMETVLQHMAGHLSPDAIITDVGSAKASIVEAARRVFGTLPPNFVPGHPIAGTEKSGVEASFAELFVQRRVILTPLPQTSAAAVVQVRRLWEAVGAEVLEMEVLHHDEVLAATSHLPHLLAYTLVDSLARDPDRPEIFRYAAGGFRDFTRIASSDPVMWRDICIANRPAILAALARFNQDLAEVSIAIEQGDGAKLLEIFRRAKTARDAYCRQELG